MVSYGQTKERRGKERKKEMGKGRKKRKKERMNEREKTRKPGNMENQATESLLAPSVVACLREFDGQGTRCTYARVS